MFDTVLVGVACNLVAISVACMRDKALPIRGVRSVFASIGAVGALIAIYPHNIYEVQHSVGSGFFVGSLWFLSVFLIHDVAKRISQTASRWLHVLLHTTVISYAIAWVLDLESRQVFQKFAVIGLCVTLLLATRILARNEKRIEADSTSVRAADSL